MSTAFYDKMSVMFGYISFNGKPEPKPVHRLYDIGTYIRFIKVTDNSEPEQSLQLRFA